MTYAFAAAGTGGHVYPALAVADELLERGVSRDDIVFFGGDRMEATTIPDAGYRFVEVEIRGLRRSWSLDNLTLPAVVWRAATRLTDAAHRSRTKVVLVMGGYISVPAAIAARRTGAAMFVHEQNAVPGLANRLIARWARTSFVAFPAAASHLARSVVVGNPLRRSLAAYDRGALRAVARKRYDMPDDLTVLGVLGGSLGARVLNELTQRIADNLDPDRTGIVHLTGRAHFQPVAAAAQRSGIRWHPVAFEREMEYFYAASDLVLGRAGALTISELAATATPSLVVPLAAVAQEGNAAHLADAGGAVVIAESDIDRVPAAIDQLLADEVRRHRMAAAAASCAKPHAAGELADALLRAAG